MPVAGGEPALELDEVTARYGGVVALDAVSLALVPGAIVGVVGANGAGKSTLLDVVCGFHRPARGRVRLGGVDVARWTPACRARAGLRRTFQRPQPFAGLTGRDDLRTAADAGRARSRPVAAGRARPVEAVLADLGLAAVADQPVADLPLGTARLLELARALVVPPAVLLLDEPTSGLTDGERARVAAVVRAQAAAGTAVVVVEHDHRFVAELCGRVVVLAAGRVVAEAPPAEALAELLAGTGAAAGAEVSAESPRSPSP